ANMAAAISNRGNAMAKFVADIIRDKGLEHLTSRASAGAVKLVVCAGEPASYTEANTPANGTAGNRKTGETAALAASAFTLGDGSPSGRSITVAAQTITLDYTGSSQTSDHAVLLDTGTSEI